MMKQRLKIERESPDINKNKWFRPSQNSIIVKVVDELVKPNCRHKVNKRAIIPNQPERQIWNTKLYRMVTSSRYKVIVEYRPMKFMELKIKERSNKMWELVDTSPNVAFPEEFTFDETNNRFQGAFHGTRDGVIKAMANLSSQEFNGSKKSFKIMEKDEKQNKRNIYSAKGTDEIITRDFDPENNEAFVKNLENLVPQKDLNAISIAFVTLCQTFGVSHTNINGDKINVLPKDKILEIFKIAHIRVPEICVRRLRQLVLMIEREVLEKHQIITLYNRSLNEAKQMHFYVTVKELQDLFTLHTKDSNNMLHISEIYEVLQHISMNITHADVTAGLQKQVNKCESLNFEEFVMICKDIYTTTNGTIVASRSDVVFNQIRSIIDDLRRRVERGHVSICHLKSELKNLDEQNDVLDNIREHSSVEKELRATKQDMNRMQELRHEMTIQHKGWVHDIKQLHAREIKDISRKENLIDERINEAKSFANDLKIEYSKNSCNATLEMKSVLHSLASVLKFTSDTIKNANQDSKQCADIFKYEQRQKLLFQEMKPGKWFSSRTDFTQEDQKQYTDRVEDVKRKRMEYDENLGILHQQLKDTQSSVAQAKLSLENREADNKSMRTSLERPRKIESSDKRMKDLKRVLDEIQEDIQNIQKEKLNLSMTLYPKEHKLQLERRKIHELQIELGELNVLIDAATQQNQELESIT